MATQVKRLKLEHEGANVQSLLWDHPVQLVGEKVTDPDLLNCCTRCFLPMLIYGRMIPCKHVLCLDCAKKYSATICSKCGDKVSRIEQSPLGTVFVCSYGGPRHGAEGCRRTYLSYRDLEAHIKHRHKKKEAVPTAAVQPLAQPQMVNLSQLPPNLIQPASHQFMRPPTHMPPHSHMVNVNHPPPGIIPNSNVPPLGLPVSLQQAHVLQSNPMTMQCNMPSMQTGPHIRPGPISLMQGTQQNTHPQRHPIPGLQMPPHQQIQGAPPPRPLRHVRPQQPLNPPVVTSKSHGNLISIPIQESNNWIGPGQPQWPNQNQGGQQQQQHRPGQYNT